MADAIPRPGQKRFTVFVLAEIRKPASTDARETSCWIRLEALWQVAITGSSLRFRVCFSARHLALIDLDRGFLFRF